MVRSSPDGQELIKGYGNFYEQLETWLTSICGELDSACVIERLAIIFGTGLRQGGKEPWMSCFNEEAAELPEWLLREYATMFDPNSFQNTNFSDDTGKPIAEARFQGLPDIPVFCIPGGDHSFLEM
jgi:hypothetical protein